MLGCPGESQGEPASLGAQVPHLQDVWQGLSHWGRYFVTSDLVLWVMSDDTERLRALGEGGAWGTALVHFGVS